MTLILFCLVALGASAFASKATSPRSYNEEEIADFYTDQVQPILVGRCVVCHSCTEAPCQLKMSSFAALERGISLENLDGTHLADFLPSRMKDASSAEQWRQRGYSTVLGDSNHSIFNQALEAGKITGAPGFDLSALNNYRKEYSAPSCPNTPAKHSGFLNQYPVGMPLGLPALSSQEYSILSNWLSLGAPGPTVQAKQKMERTEVSQAMASWEKFLNQRDANSRLTSRYIYEHTAGIHFYFPDSKGHFYELVRSRTQFPIEIQEIVTDVASSDPKTTDFYYRFKKITETIVKKTHVVWEIKSSELDRLKELFSSETWAAQSHDFSSYTQNPFEDFKSIPAKIRSLFMLRHSRLMIDQMVRGTVCVGNIASYAIRDHFWVSFLDPKSDPSVVYPSLGHPNKSISLDVKTIDSYQSDFEYYMQKMHPEGLSIQDLWKEEGNPNSQLTILRHDSTASVHNGWIGGRGKTHWLLSYSNFERLFYNVVVNFRYWGSLAHRAWTWEIMRLNRIEGEDLFITLLPSENRWSVRNQWAPGISRKLIADLEKKSRKRGSKIMLNDPQNPVESLTQQLLDYYPKNQNDLDDRLNIKGAPVLNSFEKELQKLTQIPNSFSQHLPSVLYLRIKNASGIANYYTLFVNRAYVNHNMPLVQTQKGARAGKEDDMIAFEGLHSSHPYQIFDLSENQASDFLKALSEIKTEKDFIHFKTKFALQRNDSQFWKIFDEFVAAAYQADPINAGLIDLNRFDNGQK